MGSNHRRGMSGVMRRFFVAATLAGLVHVHARVAAAQAPSRRSVDFNAIVANANGGIYSQRSTVGLDFLGAFRFGELSNGAWLAAAGAGIMPQIFGENCLIVGTHSGCAPDLPSFTTWTALAGWESGRGGQAGSRLLVGPTLYSGGGSANVGATARADLATPTLFHFAITATGRGSLVSLPGGATSLWAFGIGVRVR
jgi:hypothetical protein